jgi:hypothetical protein
LSPSRYQQVMKFEKAYTRCPVTSDQPGFSSAVSAFSRWSDRERPAHRHMLTSPVAAVAGTRRTPDYSYAQATGIVFENASHSPVGGCTATLSA